MTLMVARAAGVSGVVICFYNTQCFGQRVTELFHLLVGAHAHAQPAVRADHADKHAAPEQLVEDGLAVVEMPTEQQEVRTGLGHFERLALVGLT